MAASLRRGTPLHSSFHPPASLLAPPPIIPIIATERFESSSHHSATHISSSRSVVLVTSSLSPAISPACRPPAAAARPLSSLSRNVRARAPKRSRPRHALRHALLSRRRARDASRELCTRGPAANPNPNPTPPPPRATPPSRELCAREPAAARRPVPCAFFTRLSSGWRHVHGGQPVKHCATSLPPSLSLQASRPRCGSPRASCSRRPVPCAVFTRLPSGRRHGPTGQPANKCALIAPGLLRGSSSPSSPGRVRRPRAQHRRRARRRAEAPQQLLPLLRHCRRWESEGQRRPHYYDYYWDVHWEGGGGNGGIIGRARRRRPWRGGGGGPRAGRGWFVMTVEQKGPTS